MSHLATVCYIIFIVSGSITLIHGTDYDSLIIPGLTPSRSLGLPFPTGYYEKFITEITSKDRYQVLTVNEFVKQGATTDKVIVILMHDSDFKVAHQFYDVEKAHGLHSTYYIRPNQDYYVNWNNSTLPFLVKIEREGWEIGYHYDVLARAGNNKSIALQLFRDELSGMRLYFNVSSAASHGGTKNDYNKNLYDAYPNEMKSLGVYERYNIPNDSNVYAYVSDSEGHLNMNPIEALKTAPIGSVVMFNLHSDWWG